MKYVTVQWLFSGNITSSVIETANQNFEEVIVDGNQITFIDHDTQENYEHGGGSLSVWELGDKYKLKCNADKVLKVWEG